MSGTVNKVIIIGNVAKDPEIRNTKDGKEMASMVVATSESWKDKISNDRIDRTEWHKISVFTEGLVNIVKNYIKKGMKIYVQGSIQTRKWTDEQNIARYSTEIVVQGYNSAITMLSGKPENSSHDEHKSSENSGYNEYNSSGKSNQNEYKSYDSSDSDEDDLPF